MKQTFTLGLRKTAITIFEDCTAAGRPAQRCAQLHKIDPSAPSARFRKALATLDPSLRRSEAATLIQLRTEHFPLNRYLYNIGASPSLNCKKCGADRPETVFHYLLHCPAHNRTRQTLRRRAPKAAASIAKLLTPGKDTTHLLTYIRETKRFAAAPSASIERDQGENGDDRPTDRPREEKGEGKAGIRYFGHGWVGRREQSTREKRKETEGEKRDRH
jgi:hypothetical protein